MKTKKEVLDTMIEEAQESLYRAEILEKFYQVKVFKDKKYELPLGQAQRQIRESKEVVESLRELKKNVKDL